MARRVPGAQPVAAHPVEEPARLPGLQTPAVTINPY
jgi:hypothetical protein